MPVFPFGHGWPAVLKSSSPLGRLLESPRSANSHSLGVTVARPSLVGVRGFVHNVTTGCSSLPRCRLASAGDPPVGPSLTHHCEEFVDAPLVSVRPNTNAPLPTAESSGAACLPATARATSPVGLAFVVPCQVTRGPDGSANARLVTWVAIHPESRQRTRCVGAHWAWPARCCLRNSPPGIHTIDLGRAHRAPTNYRARPFRRLTPAGDSIGRRDTAHRASRDTTHPRASVGAHGSSGRTILLFGGLIPRCWRAQIIGKAALRAARPDDGPAFLGLQPRTLVYWPGPKLP